MKFLLKNQHSPRFNNIKTEFSQQLINFVPKHRPLQDSDVKILDEFIKNSKKLLVLTGAGISTESGIPDYRSEEVGLYARSKNRPIIYQEFIKSASTRQRYWARNYVGWPRFSQCEPNTTHKCLKKLEDEKKISGIITQNVDNLHFKAGSKNIIELHGTAFKVICLKCESIFNRHEIQEKIKQLNPTLTENGNIIRPDGDVELSQDITRLFQTPFCDNCGGILKPDIVFFGDNVPKRRVEAVRSLVSKSDALLILGSSLSVFSGYRIILQAAEENKNIAIVNIGPTRADDLPNIIKLTTKCGDILPKVC